MLLLLQKHTNVSIDGIILNEEIVFQVQKIKYIFLMIWISFGSRRDLRRFPFQVTPEFTIDIVMGIEAKISILKSETCKVLTYFYLMRSTKKTVNRYPSPENSVSVK